MDDPKIISAIIAGLVSLIVAGSSGVYVLYQSNSKLKSLRDELITTKKAERFVEKCYEYRQAYRALEEEGSQLGLSNLEDGTELLQLLIDFHANYGRDFYLENQDILGSEDLDDELTNIANLVGSGIINQHEHPDRMTSIKALYQSIKVFSSTLFKKSLKY